MTRILLINLLLFLLPFLIYGGWRWLVVGDRNSREVINDAPVFILLAAAISLVALGLFALASYDKPGVEGRYVPPVYKDGRIEPGHFEKREPR